MRFLVDECTGPGVARWLTSEPHDAFVVLTDTQIRFAALAPRHP